VLTTELAILAYGNRSGNGGVIALDRASGVLCWQVSCGAIEGGLTLSNGHLFLATWNSKNSSGGELLCLEAATGKIIWQHSLKNGAWAAPVVNFQRVYVGCSDDRVYCFDASNGRPSGGSWPAAVGRGRKQWLIFAHDRLFVFSESGQVSCLQRIEGNPVTAPWNIGVRISGAPAWDGGAFYVGLEGGKLAVLDPFREHSRILADGFNNLFSTPVLNGDLLYVGGLDGTLRAINKKTNIEIWRYKFNHSPAAAPSVQSGLVFVITNGGNLAHDGFDPGKVYALDASTGEPIWEWALAGQPGLMGGLVFHNDTVYVSGGQAAAALPWHLGKYEWAANRLRAQKQPVEASEYYAAAADFDCSADGSRRQCYDQVIALFRQVGWSEYAARLREALLDDEPSRIAREFEEAVTLTKLQRTDKFRAANLLRRAADWYERAGDMASKLRCEQKAMQIPSTPYLHLRNINLPQGCPAEEPFDCELEVKNMGSAAASQVRVRLGGGCLARAPWVQIEQILAGGVAEIQASLVPITSGELVVEVRYEDPQGNSWSNTQRFPLQVGPWRQKIEIGGDVGFLDVKSFPPGISIRVKGDVGAAVFEVEAPKPQPTPPPDSQWPEREPGFVTDEVTLIHLEEVEAEFTVPLGEWAIFLADEQPIGKFPPGRYTRQDFKELHKSKPLSGRSPRWQALCFQQSTVRLAYRLGLYPAEDFPQLGVEVGLNIGFDPDQALAFWQQAGKRQPRLSAEELHQWLFPQVSGIVQIWARHLTQQKAAAGLDLQDELALVLEETLRKTCQEIGLQELDHLWFLRLREPCPSCGWMRLVGQPMCEKCGSV
jgi:outer membrane protein assembly factor BamB